MGEPGAQGSERRSKPPHPVFNWLTVVGLALAVSGLSAALFFLLIGFALSGASGYAGLTFIPPLGLALLGLLLGAIGLVRERRRQRRGRHSSFLERIVIDPLAFVRTTGPLLGFGALALGTFALLGAGAGSLAVVEYTESNEFCGETCHQVMGPEATVYAHSPHARIQCVECHVGPGGDAYLQAKLGGLRQIWAVATANVARPIPTPIRNRRLSREMCESCHTSDRYIGYKALTHTYFPSGHEDEPVSLRMIVKVGGGGDGLIPGAGIHYHMLAKRKVEYIARDPARQEIAWIRVTESGGAVKEFSNASAPITDEERAALEIRAMECVDCHSRPAHRFTSPARSVNAAIGAGKIPSNLRRIKEASIRALDGRYKTTADAMTQIGARLHRFYEKKKKLGVDAKALDQVVPVLQEIYRTTIFPEMKADWRAHPDNLGHRDSPGCFRCHNDEMLDDKGEAIFTDCTKCHAILAQNEEMIATPEEFDEGRSFVHPDDSEIFEEFTLCTECHTGGREVYD